MKYSSCKSHYLRVGCVPSVISSQRCEKWHPPGPVHIHGLRSIPSLDFPRIGDGFLHSSLGCKKLQHEHWSMWWWLINQDDVDHRHYNNNNTSRRHHHHYTRQYYDGDHVGKESVHEIKQHQRQNSASGLVVTILEMATLSYKWCDQFVYNST